jgi:carbonic anhydrase
MAPIPAEGLIIVTCMDVRIDPHACFGLAPGSAHVLRNAGARVTEDVVRSIVVSTKLMGTDHVLILGHTHCGLASISNHELGELVASSYDTARQVEGRWVVDGRNGGALAARGYDFCAIQDVEQSVASDVFRTRWHPMLPPNLRVDGFVLDVMTGAVRAVASGGSLSDNPSLRPSLREE